MKIWFQNRRARERRDKSLPSEGLKPVEASENISQDRPSPLFHAMTPLVTSQQPEEPPMGLIPTNQMQSILNSRWSYLQALHGFYQNYRPLVANAQFPFFNRNPQVASSLLNLRQPPPPPSIQTRDLHPWSSVELLSRAMFQPSQSIMNLSCLNLVSINVLKSW